MTRNEQEDRMAQTLCERPGLLKAVASFLISDDALFNDNSYEIAEAVCVETFGQRVPCKGDCGALLLPGFSCLDCDEEPEGRAALQRLQGGKG